MSITVLVVDDSPTMRHTLRTILAKNGMSVEEARSGQEALGYLSPGHPFDVVVTDLRMPGMDGQKLIDTMQRDADLCALPVMVLTADEDPDAHVRNLDSGAAAFITKGRLDASILLATVRRLARQRNVQLELQRDSRTDKLTTLCNRRHGEVRLAEALALSRRHNEPLAVVMVDIDHFKRINDTLGHAAGDDVLKRVAAELRRNARVTDIVSRWGGEEFLFMFPRTTLKDAVGIVERFRRQLPEAVKVAVGNVEIPVTVSAGAAVLEGNEDSESLIARADQALYKAKESGRNKLMLWQFGRLESPTPAAA